MTKSTHGGKRKGAGRPLARGVKGKTVKFWLYPTEKEKVQQFIKEMRGEL